MQSFSICFNNLFAYDEFIYLLMTHKWNSAVGTNELIFHGDQEKYHLYNFDRGSPPSGASIRLLLGLPCLLIHDNFTWKPFHHEPP